MAKKKQQQQQERERKGLNINVWVGAELGEAFEAYIAAASPRPSRTAAIEASLEAFLREKGFWPPPSPAAARPQEVEKKESASS